MNSVGQTINGQILAIRVDGLNIDGQTLGENLEPGHLYVVAFLRHFG